MAREGWGAMQADYSIELGEQDECLEVPWAHPDGALRYLDLKRRPELLLNVEEAHHNQELGEFLVAINSDSSILETAKCDAWLSNELEEEEEIYGAAWKFGSYVDLVFTLEEARYSLSRHQETAERVTTLLKCVPEISAAAEFILRRCYFHPGQDLDADSRPGFCFTFYLFGYGDDEDEARRRWGIALKVVQNALLQLSAEQRRASGMIR